MAPKPKMKKAATLDALPTVVAPAPMERSLSFNPSAKSVMIESVKPVVEKSAVVEDPVLIVEDPVVNGAEEPE